MLVGAFQVEVGNPVRRAIGAVAQHEGMGGARVEPDVKDIKDLLIILPDHEARSAPFP